MQKIKILIADDHVILRENMHTLFSAEDDFEIVGMAADGQQAVCLAQEKSPQVVLMDAVMPVLDGVSTLKEIKNSVPACHVLVLSAYSDNNYILQMLQNGADGYLLKSARKEEIVAAARVVASGGSVFDSLVSRKLVEMIVRLSEKSVAPSHSSPLSLREIEVLQAASEGLGNKEVAERYNLTERTVKNHMSNIFNKMGVSSRAEAIFKGLKEGYIELS